MVDANLLGFYQEFVTILNQKINGHSNAHYTYVYGPDTR